MGPGRIRNPRPPTRSSPVEVIRTWEDGGPASGLPFFVVIPVIHLHRHDILMCSHVHRGGSVHMGAHQHISTETQEPCHDRENSHPLCLDPALPCAVPFLRGPDSASTTGGPPVRTRLPLRPGSASVTRQKGQDQANIFSPSARRRWPPPGSEAGRRIFRRTRCGAITHPSRSECGEPAGDNSTRSCPDARPR